ncbi:hypothetical protein [uncultured Sphingomonas sp.]|uniref:hypothetical protein n=1 Tax=uncultured Sphingomonas sp. TaxID=158754 RepID=UPI0025D50D09|nr:hypothetical protein [uncultured Sphingomonas sp.]
MTRDKAPTSMPTEPAHTAEGAPTDAAHAAAGDGTLQGAIPAGLTPEQLAELVESPPTDDGGTG